VMSIFNSFVV